MTRGTTRAMRVVESNKRPAHRGLKRRPAIPIAWFARLHRRWLYLNKVHAGAGCDQ